MAEGESRKRSRKKPETIRLLRHLLEQQEHLMAVAQVIQDAQNRLSASIAALNAKVDAVIAAQAGSMSAADAQAVADATNKQADAVDAEAAKLP